MTVTVIFANDETIEVQKGDTQTLNWMLWKDFGFKFEDLVYCMRVWKKPGQRARFMRRKRRRK